MNSFTVREQIVETVHKLFIYTDEQQWDKIQTDVFTENVLFDMSSLGMEIKTLPAKDICDTWQQGFKSIDSINHLCGNILVTLQEGGAHVFAYATATHYKAAAISGNTREFTGTYDIHLINTHEGWRIDQFKYLLKYMTGNAELK